MRFRIYKYTYGITLCNPFSSSFSGYKSLEVAVVCWTLLRNPLLHWSAYQWVDSVKFLYFQHIFYLSCCMQSLLLNGTFCDFEPVLRVIEQLLTPVSSIVPLHLQPCGKLCSCSVPRREVKGHCMMFLQPVKLSSITFRRYSLPRESNHSQVCSLCSLLPV